MVGIIVRASGFVVFQITINQLSGKKALFKGLVDHMITVRSCEFSFRTSLIPIFIELHIMGVRGPRAKPATRSLSCRCKPKTGLEGESIHGVNTGISALG